MHMDQQAGSGKKFYKRWWFWVGAVVLLFIIIGSSGSSSPSKVGDSASATAEQTTFKVGDQIKGGDTILTVTKVTPNWKSTNQFDKPSNSDNAYVLVTVEIQNTGKSALDLSSLFDFKLEDGNGAIRNQSIGGVGIKNLSSIGAIAPGGKASGDILFEASKDALAKLVLHYDPAFSYGKEILIELQ